MLIPIRAASYRFRAIGTKSSFRCSLQHGEDDFQKAPAEGHPEAPLVGLSLTDQPVGKRQIHSVHTLHALAEVIEEALIGASQ